MATPLTLRTGRRADGTLEVSAAGELDLSNIAAFTQAIAEALRTESRDGQKVAVDLSAVEYLDSGAINALFEHADRIRQIVANPILMPVLKVSGLAGVAAVQAAPPSPGE
ncbi:STAS domain-containing protein [Mycobacterium sp. B14F4]|uniref:STAS domain-containing protein n=1 Tax=Mycobacterium sp. B14F4 TaxID=3153565 RepID=UPI00325D2E8D